MPTSSIGVQYMPLFASLLALHLFDLCDQIFDSLLESMDLRYNRCFNGHCSVRERLDELLKGNLGYLSFRVVLRHRRILAFWIILIALLVGLKPRSCVLVCTGVQVGFIEGENYEWDEEEGAHQKTVDMGIRCRGKDPPKRVSQFQASKHQAGSRFTRVETPRISQLN